MADEPAPRRLRKARYCMVGGCMGEVRHGHRMCAAHYAALPGRTRSQLSLAARARRSAVTDEIWDRARGELEEMP